MGSNATFLPRLWHGLDPIIDYQLFVGGPNNRDINAHCSRRHYTQRHCDFDGTSICSTDNESAVLASGSRCRGPGGDEYFSLGEFTNTFARLKPDEYKQWHVLPNSGHCEAWSSGFDVIPM